MFFTNLQFRGFTNHLLVNCSTFSTMYLNTVMSETLRCILKKTSRVLHHYRRNLQFRGYHPVTCTNSVQLPAPDPSHQLSCPAAACPPPRPTSRVEDLPRQKQLSPPAGDCGAGHLLRPPPATPLPARNTAAITPGLTLDSISLGEMNHDGHKINITTS